MAELHETKFLEFRLLTRRLIVAFAVLITALWPFDWYYDPGSAPQTLGLRLLASGIALSILVCTSRAFSNSVKGVMLYTGICAVQLVYMLILSRIDGGFTVGMGGFLYFLLACVLLGLPFSLRVNIVGTLVVLLAPHLWGLLWVDGFGHYPYLLLILPAGLICLFFQWAANLLIIRGFRYRDEIEHYALQDPLTGLLNRRALEHDFGVAVERQKRDGEPLSLIMVDIDFFKTINDTHGHGVGDIVLKELAGIMVQQFRASDSVARIGGEEFVCLLPGLSLDEAACRGEQLRQDVVAHPFNGHGGKGDAIRATVSLGVTGYHPGESFTALLERADKALYEAKHGGRNALVRLD